MVHDSPTAQGFLLALVHRDPSPCAVAGDMSVTLLPAYTSGNSSQRRSLHLRFSMSWRTSPLGKRSPVPLCRRPILNPGRFIRAWSSLRGARRQLQPSPSRRVPLKTGNAAGEGGVGERDERVDDLDE